MAFSPSCLRIAFTLQLYSHYCEDSDVQSLEVGEIAAEAQLEATRSYF